MTHDQIITIFKAALELVLKEERAKGVNTIDSGAMNTPNRMMPKWQLGKIADLEQYSMHNTHVHTAPIHDVIHMRDLPEYTKPQCKCVQAYLCSSPYYYSHFPPVTSSISSLLFAYLRALCSFVTELSLFHVHKEIKLVLYMCPEVCVFV